jgi:hypothetical protein
VIIVDLGYQTIAMPQFPYLLHERIPSEGKKVKIKRVTVS